MSKLLRQARTFAFACVALLLAVTGSVVPVFAADTAGHSATGILLDGCSNVVVSNSRVLGPGAGTAPKAVSTGLATVTTTNLILLSNIVTGMDAGFNLSGAASGKYGDNITASDSTPYNSAGTGMTDIGNNN